MIVAADPDWLGQIFNFANYGELLVLLRNSIIAGAVLGIVGGLIGVFVMARDMPFAVHGISELSFAGASAGLLFGIGVVPGSIIGSLVAALLIGALEVAAVAVMVVACPVSLAGVWGRGLAADPAPVGD